MDYSALKTRVIGFTENDSLTDAQIEYFLDNAESKIYRDIDFFHARRFTGPQVLGTDPIWPLPAGCLTVRFVEIVSSNARSFLLQKEPSFMDEYSVDRTVTGVPLFYARYDDANIILSPTPDGDRSIDIGYTVRPGVMNSTSTQTTWLGTNAPNLLFSAVMLEVLKYSKGESTQLGVQADSPGYWEVVYKEEMARVKAEQEKLNRTDSYRTGSPVF